MRPPPSTETNIIMKRHLRKFAGRKGYSLLELVLVLAIVAVLVGLLLPKGFDALRTARVQQVEKTVDTLKTAIVDYLALSGGNGSLPRTEGTGIPTSGAALTGATDVAKGNAARLDTVLLATGRLERPLSLRMGTQSYVSTGSGNEITWSQSSLAFVMTPDAVPQRNWSAVTRVEARTANPASLPSAALGANFRLDGTTNLNANSIVAYLVIPACPARDAYELAVSMNGGQLAPVEGAACDAGVVAYAAPANGVTDVYIYLTAI
jgi:prepilin-type N-terminal cleavage/methylation domain-containing protein